MKYNSNIHHRKSIRLKGYDYSQGGFYFITICTQNRDCLFGEITNDEMKLNDAGKMIEHWYYELENKFNDIKCHDMVIMPNHLHCIIENVGADLRVCPQSYEHDNLGEHDTLGEHVGSPLRVCPQSGEHDILGEHVGSPLRDVVRWFKTMTTNYYIRGVKEHDYNPFDGKLWQRNYWEHIIRNQNEYQRIAEYIIDNPRQWGNDKLKTK